MSEVEVAEGAGAEVVDETPLRRPTIAVAMIGHHRSGKSSLTAALSSILADRPGARAERVSVAELDRRSGSPPMELFDGVLRRSGTGPRDGVIETLTVRPPKIECESASRRFVVVDCPGYRRWSKNSARGQAIVDAAILVVSGPESVQAQTREQLFVARGLGLEQLIVWINKCDRVEDLEWLDLVERDVRDLLDEVGLDGDQVRILRGAAGAALAGERAWEASLHDLVEALESELTVPNHPRAGTALVYVDHIHSGRYPVGDVLVQGRVRRGQIVRGDALALVGVFDSVPVRVVDIEVFHRKVDRADAGEQVGLMLARLGTRLRRHEVASGQALVGGDLTIAQAATTRGLRVRLRLLRADEGGRHTPIHRGHTVHLIFGTAVTSGVIEGIDGAVQPGAEIEALIRLWVPLYLEPGMPVVVRDGAQGHQHLVGGAPVWSGTAGVGTILETSATAATAATPAL